MVGISFKGECKLIEVYTDGAANGNPGLSGAGIYIKTNNEPIEYAFPLGRLSNHEAELYAVMKAIEICLEHYPTEIQSFHSDSQLVVDMIEKRYTKNATYQPLLAIVLEKISLFPHFFIKWIPSKQNFHADRLAKQAIHMNEE